MNSRIKWINRQVQVGRIFLAAGFVVAVVGIVLPRLAGDLAINTRIITGPGDPAARNLGCLSRPLRCCPPRPAVGPTAGQRGARRAHAPPAMEGRQPGFLGIHRARRMPS